MTEQTKRFVVGIDPLVSSTSLAIFAEGRDEPLTRVLHSDPPTRDFSVISNVQRTQRTADSVMAAVLTNGLPELVVMAKPICGDHRRDASGPRRMMLAGEIEKRLVDAEIPVAELPPMTIIKWLLSGNHTYPPRDFEKIETRIRDLWRPPDAGDKYRLTTVALAAAGAIAVGIPTRHPVTNGGLATLGASMILPPGWKLPETEPQWRAKHELTREGKTDAA